MHLLELNNIVKQYQDTLAVNNVSLEVPHQTIFGLLGPNGAGKTTLIRIITDIIKADSGEVLLEGSAKAIDRIRNIGYMPEERGLYKKMKVGEQLMYLSRLKDLSDKRAKEQLKYWMNKFDILDWWGKQIGELSKGMQQKIQFIATVMHDPKLIILDEPFSGLDPINANLIREEIYELKEKGATIIFSTHRMEQVEEICESIALIHKGEKILSGDLEVIKNTYKENLYHVEHMGELNGFAEGPFKIMNRNENDLIFNLKPEQQPNELLKYLIDSGVQVHEFNEILPSINEIFIKEVGGESDE